MEIIIAGDMVPTSSNEKLFAHSDLESLLGPELLEVWKSADYRIVNIEAPITSTSNEIAKCGPNLIISPITIKGIKNLDITAANLANNHILDQGASGLSTTINYLSGLGIRTFGAGENLAEARKAIFIDDDINKVGIFSCAENEFSIATNTSAGANPFDPFESLDEIGGVKDECDYLIVLYHGGREHYRYPTPYQQKVCRKIVEKGADLVVCQHSHAIGCEEIINDARIVYGQGNFIFDYRDDEYWQTSLVLQVTIDDGIHIEYIPIVKQDNTIRIPDKIIGSNILSEYKTRSKNITIENFVEDHYDELVKSSIDRQLAAFSQLPSFLEKIDRKVIRPIFKKSFLLRKNYLLKTLNNLECESHRELIIHGLKKKT
jgi:hypothetical protein